MAEQIRASTADSINSRWYLESFSYRGFSRVTRVLLRGSRVRSVGREASRNEIGVSKRARISGTCSDRNKWNRRAPRQTKQVRSRRLRPRARATLDGDEDDDDDDGDDQDYDDASLLTQLPRCAPYPSPLIPAIALRVIIYIIVIVLVHLLILHLLLLLLFFSASFSSHRSSSSFRTGPSSFSAGYRCFHHSREGPRLPLPRSYLPPSLFFFSSSPRAPCTLPSFNYLRADW